MTMMDVFAGDEVLTRAATVEAVDDQQGIIDVRLMTYEREAQLDEDLSEVFTRGAFAAAVGNPSRVKVSDQGHQRTVIIGHATELRDAEDALYGRLRIVETTQGRDVLTLLRAGSLSELSVEFRPQRRFMRVQRRDGGILVRHDKATLVGVSPVGAGAYGEASRVLAVREARKLEARERALAHLQSLNSGRGSY